MLDLKIIQNERTVTITKHVEFEACHNLLDYEGKCKNLHGHTYKLEVALYGKVNEKGFLIDFKDLKALLESAILNKVDHQYLNEVFDREFNLKDVNTTCENLVWVFWMALEAEMSKQPEIYKDIHVLNLRLWETSNSFATLSHHEMLPFQLHNDIQYSGGKIDGCE